MHEVVNAVGVDVIGQWSETALAYYRYLNGIVPIVSI